MRPLARNNEDIVDATVRAHRRMAFADDVQATPLAFDYGPGEGALVVNDLRRTAVSGSLMPLRSVSDTNAVVPGLAPQPGGTTAWQMNDTALSKSLASRATSGQILISRDADDDTRLAFLQALREAGQTETSAGAPLTRIMAWVSEILLRPLVQPCFRISREASERSARPSGRMRKRR